MNLSVKNFEHRSTFGEVMDNIIVDCFLTHSVSVIYWLKVQTKNGGIFCSAMCIFP